MKNLLLLCSIVERIGTVIHLYLYLYLEIIQSSTNINKRLKPRVPDGCVIHSFRRTMRDRRRAVECPSDMIDQIGGWATAGVGQSYGKGYNLDVLAKRMMEIRC